MNIQWSAKPFDRLSVSALYDLLRLRSDVFVVEQQCVYPDLDGEDRSAMHVMGHDARGRLIAYSRILKPEADGFPHIGRVVVHPDHRGQGLAHQVMEHSLELLMEHYGSKRSRLSAQCHLEAFYTKHGYARIGPDHDLDGIPHVDMERGG